MQIRPERRGDVAPVFGVHRAAFGRPEEAELVDVLRASANPQLSLVAERESRVVGHIFFSPVRIENAEPLACAGLAPVAVRPEHQGLGIGAALVRAGLEQCGERGWRAVFLVGSPAYYGRFGFTLAAPRGLHYGDADFDRAFQVRELMPGALGARRGRVRFHPAFYSSR